MPCTHLLPASRAGVAEMLLARAALKLWSRAASSLMQLVIPSSNWDGNGDTGERVCEGACNLAYSNFQKEAIGERACYLAYSNFQKAGIGERARHLAHSNLLKMTIGEIGM